MHDFTARQIAELLEMKVATVRSNVRHTRARLRKHYEAANPDDLFGTDGGER
jgi:DNA-directed RNA polymerase specialized sigma24 family protein